jgi:hypothetical protein
MPWDETIERQVGRPFADELKIRVVLGNAAGSPPMFGSHLCDEETAVFGTDGNRR